MTPFQERRMKKIACPLCNQNIDEELIELHTVRDKIIIEFIKKKKPEWMEDSGACPRCLEYYRKLESN